ncbi:hypothetical protein [Vreelandella sp. EE22]
MAHPNRDSQNAAWQAAHQWRAKAASTQPAGLLGTLKLMLVWLAFGALMIVGVVFGLILLLVGWALMPFMRHKMKKRMEQMRADQARDVGGSFEGSDPAPGGGRPHARQDAIEGTFEVKDTH